MDFTFTIRTNAEPYQEGLAMAFSSPQEAIEGARTILQATIDNRPLSQLAVMFATIGVGMGSIDQQDMIVWLGEWEWAEEEADWVWTPSG